MGSASTPERVPATVTSHTTATSAAPTVVALVPAFNEEAKIYATVEAILGIDEVTRVVVIDDGSKDGTAQYAVDAGAKAIRLNRNIGKGPALEYAIKQAEDADIILLLDGDLGHTAEQAELLLKPVLDGSVDMAIARFPRPAGKAGFGFVKGLAHAEILRAGGTDEQAQAPLSGQRAVTRECLDAIRPFAKGYGVEVALTVRALRKGYRVLEIPTTMTHNATGRDLAGFVHRARQFRNVFLTIVSLRIKG